MFSLPATATPVRAASQAFPDENSTPRTAMTLSRREQLERWRASKKQKSQAAPLAVVDTNINSLDGEKDPNKALVTYAKDLGRSEPHEVPTPKESERALLPSDTNEITESVPALTGDLERQESESSSSGSSSNHGIAEDEPVSQDEEQCQSEANEGNHTIIDENELVEVENMTAAQESDTAEDKSNDMILNEMKVESTYDANQAEEETNAESTYDANQAKAEKNDEPEYDINMLILANDTLVHELAASESRHFAEISALRQERDQLRLELEMQETRFKSHIQRLEKSSRDSLAAMMEHIEDLSKQLMEAHTLITTLTSNRHSEAKYQPSENRPQRASRRGQRELDMLSS